MKKESLKEKLIILTIVLGMNWGYTLFLWVNDRHLLTQGSYIPLLLYIFELVVGILWIILFIYHIGVLRKNGNNREKFISIRDKLMIATLVCVLHWTPGIPTLLGEHFGEFFWKNYYNIVYLCYLLIFIIVGAVLLFSYLIMKKKIEGQEEKKEKLQLMKHRLAITAFVVGLQCVIVAFDTYGNPLVFFGYRVIFTTIWVAFLIYYFIFTLEKR